MRKLYFLVPGTRGKFGGGGLWAELNTVHLAQEICEAEVVTYRVSEKQHPFLADILPTCDPKSAIFVIGWGFDVPKIINQLQGHNIIYHAHSANYGFALPSNVPIITVSRNTMGYWGEKAANNLIPALQSLYKVEIITSYVEDLAGLFNRSKIYLYDSAEYWAVSGVTEGFGLPPLEALACGCQVFSSVNHGLSDYLDPGFNCYKISNYSLEYDLHRIRQSLETRTTSADSLVAEYRQDNLIAKLEVILTDINHFFDVRSQHSSNNIQSLNKGRITQLKIKKIISKLRQKLTKN